jgi:hypothetical protein
MAFLGKYWSWLSWLHLFLGPCVGILLILLLGLCIFNLLAKFISSCLEFVKLQLILEMEPEMWTHYTGLSMKLKRFKVNLLLYIVFPLFSLKLKYITEFRNPINLKEHKHNCIV